MLYLPRHCIHLFCHFVALASYVCTYLSAIFLHYMRGLELNFYVVLTILEYSIACTLCTKSNPAVIPIERNTYCSRWSAGMYPTVMPHFISACNVHATHTLLKLNRSIGIIFEGYRYETLFMKIYSHIGSINLSSQNNYFHSKQWVIIVHLMIIFSRKLLSLQIVHM